MEKHIAIIFLLFGLLMFDVSDISGQTANKMIRKAEDNVSADSLVKDVKVLTQANENLDTAFTSDAQIAYYTASNSNGRGVFRTSVSDSTSAAVFVGTPFVSPRGLAVASDDKNIYVADPKAKGNGSIFVQSANGGTPQVLSGTTGYKPRGLEVFNQNGTDTIYFTGQDPQDGQQGVFKIAASGDKTPQVVAKGVPFVSPDSVAIASNGDVYVTDNKSGGKGQGSVWKISDGQVTSLVKSAWLGNPAGVALTLDEQTLLVSAVQTQKGQARVLVVNLKTGEQSSITSVIGANPKAGGLHRARNSNSFVWADIIRQIYSIFTRP